MAKFSLTVIANVEIITVIKRRMINHTDLISNPLFITLAAHVRFLHLVKNLPEEWKKQKNVTSTDFGNSLSNNSNFPSNENEIKDFIFNNSSAEQQYGASNRRTVTSGDVLRDSTKMKDSLDSSRDKDRERNRDTDKDKDIYNGNKNQNDNHQLGAVSASIHVAGEEFVVDERRSSSNAQRENIRTKTDKVDKNSTRITDYSKEGRSLFRDSEFSEKDLGKEEERRMHQQQNINLSSPISSTLLLSRPRTPLCHLFSSSPPPSTRTSLPLSSAQQTQRASLPFNQQIKSSNVIESDSQTPWTRVNTRQKEAPSEIAVEVSQHYVIMHF